MSNCIFNFIDVFWHLFSEPPSCKTCYATNEVTEWFKSHTYQNELISTYTYKLLGKSEGGSTRNFIRNNKAKTASRIMFSK